MSSSKIKFKKSLKNDSGADLDKKVHEIRVELISLKTCCLVL